MKNKSPVKKPLIAEKMKIGYTAKRLFHNNSGLGNFSRTLVSSVNRYSDHSIYLFDQNPSKTRHKEFLELPYHIVDSNIPLWKEFFMKKSISEKNLDLFHGLSHSLPYNIGKLDLPTLVTMHDVIFLKFKKDFSFIDRQLYKRKWSHAIKNADKIHAISKSTADDLMQEFNISADKIEIIPLSIPQGLLHGEQDIRIMRKLNLNRPFFLYVGDLGERKNVSLIIDALSRGHKTLKKSVGAYLLNKDVCLIVVSRDQKGIDRLTKISEERGVSESITFLSDIDDATLFQLYKSARALIYPSLYEGFGLPILEAMALGTPVIAAHNSSLPEVGGDAIMYLHDQTPEELVGKMSDVLNDNILASQLSERGLKRSQLYTPERITGHMLELYQRMV